MSSCHRSSAWPSRHAYEYEYPQPAHVKRHSGLGARASAGAGGTVEWTEARTEDVWLLLRTHVVDLVRISRVHASDLSRSRDYMCSTLFIEISVWLNCTNGKTTSITESLSNDKTDPGQF